MSPLLRGEIRFVQKCGFFFFLFFFPFLHAASGLCWGEGGAAITITIMYVCSFATDSIMNLHSIA